MQSSKMFTLMGFAMRSGNIVSGEEMCRKGIMTGKVTLMLVASDISAKTGEKIRELCDSLNIKHIDVYTKKQISDAIGKEDKTLVGLTNKKFSREIWNLYEQSRETGNNSGGGNIVKD